MTVRTIRVSGVEFYCGLSSSGHSTRTFSDPQDAEAEEKWLDEKWQLCVALWAGLPSLTPYAAQDRALAALEDVMAEAQKGLRPLLDPECPKNLELFRSDGPGQEPHLLVFEGDHAVGEFRGESYSQIQGDLRRVPGNGPPRR